MEGGLSCRAWVNVVRVDARLFNIYLSLFDDTIVETVELDIA